MTFRAGSGLLQDDRRDGGEANVEERAPHRYAQGAVRAGERRPPRLERAWALLRELAHLSGGARRRVGDDLRRSGERVVRLGDLAQRRSRRDVGALERGDRLPGRGRRLEAVEGLVRDARARPATRRRGVGRPVREHRRRQDLLARDDVRGPGRPRGVERPGATAARPPRPVRDHPAPGGARPLLDHRPGLQPVRDDRRRQDVDAPQQGPPPRLARRLRGDRLLRPQGGARRRLREDVPAEPRRHAPFRRRRPDVDGDHGGPADGLRLRSRDAPARPRRLLRDPARRWAGPDDAGRSRRRLANARRRLELAATRQRPADRRRLRRSPARGHGVGRPRPAGPLLRHEHRPAVREPDEGESWGQVGGLFPGITSVTVANVE